MFAGPRQLFRSLAFGSAIARDRQNSDNVTVLIADRRDDDVPPFRSSPCRRAHAVETKGFASACSLDRLPNPWPGACGPVIPPECAADCAEVRQFHQAQSGLVHQLELPVRREHFDAVGTRVEDASIESLLLGQFFADEHGFMNIGAGAEPARRLSFWPFIRPGPDQRPSVVPRGQAKP